MYFYNQRRSDKTGISRNDWKSTTVSRISFIYFPTSDGIRWAIERKQNPQATLSALHQKIVTKNGKCWISIKLQSFLLLLLQIFLACLRSLSSDLLSLSERCLRVISLTRYSRLHRYEIIAFQVIDSVIKRNLYIFINWLSVLKIPL